MSQSNLIQVMYLVLFAIAGVLATAMWLLVGYIMERNKQLHKVYRFVTILLSVVLVFVAFYMLLGDGQALLSALQ